VIVVEHLVDLFNVVLPSIPAYLVLGLAIHMRAYVLSLQMDHAHQARELHRLTVRLTRTIIWAVATIGVITAFSIPAYLARTERSLAPEVRSIIR